MGIKDDYDLWALSYDNDSNSTRDTESKSFADTISNLKYNRVLELGCGTGKNTSYLANTSQRVTAVDFSPKMLEIARKKISSDIVRFKIIDLRKNWNLTESFDLITCSLTLEHIKSITRVFSQAYQYLEIGGNFYLGELHPVKKYLGEGYPRYTIGNSTHKITSYTHHFSDYINTAVKQGFEIIECRDWFKPENKIVPNVISFVFRKTKK